MRTSTLLQLSVELHFPHFTIKLGSALRRNCFLCEFLKMETSKEQKKRKKRESLEVKMDYVPSKEGRGRPFVSYFPTGFDPVRAATANAESRLTEIKAYQGVEKLRAKQTQLVASTQGQVDFVGLNYTGEAAMWNPCSYALGVFDKEKGTLKLVPLAGEKIFRMDARVQGVDYDLAAPDEEVEEPQTKEMALLKRRLLVETFGSQKSKMRALRAERGIVKEEALGDSLEMESLFQEAGKNEALLTNEQALQQANLAVVRNIPPHDISANTPEGAYPLDKIISQEEWDSLEVHELKVAAKKAKDEEALRLKKKYPNFVLSRLRRIRVEGDKEGNDRRARILVYLRHLLTFRNAPNSLLKGPGNPLSNPGRSSDSKIVNLSQELDIPGEVLATFLSRFTAENTLNGQKSGGRHRDKEHIELQISYVLVLGLFVDDFQADPYDLAIELKMAIGELRPHYKELGCKIEARSVQERKELGDSKTGQGKWRVTLPVPLNFPQIVVPRGRPGRGR